MFNRSAPLLETKCPLFHKLKSGHPSFRPTHSYPARQTHRERGIDSVTGSKNGGKWSRRFCVSVFTSVCNHGAGRRFLSALRPPQCEAPPRWERTEGPGESHLLCLCVCLAARHTCLPPPAAPSTAHVPGHQIGTLQGGGWGRVGVWSVITPGWYHGDFDAVQYHTQKWLWLLWSSNTATHRGAPCLTRRLVTFALKMFWSPCIYLFIHLFIYLFVCVLLA